MSKSDGGILRRNVPVRIHVPEGQVRALESHHASDFMMQADAWPFHKVCWVAMGQGFLNFERKNIEIQKNDFLLIPAEKVHHFIDVPSAPLTLVMLCISPHYVSVKHDREMGKLWNALSGNKTFKQAFCAKNGFHHSNLVKSFRFALREQALQKVGWETALKSAAASILLHLARGSCEPSSNHSASSAQNVEGAIEYIDTHMQEALQIETVAEQCNLSPRRFTDLFKQQTGHTFSNYLNKKRIEHACQRLDETGQILYACYESGFNDPGYFYRVFKKVCGVTPGQYLRETKKR